MRIIFCGFKCILIPFFSMKASLECLDFKVFRRKFVPFSQPQTLVALTACMITATATATHSTLLG